RPRPDRLEEGPRPPRCRRRGSVRFHGGVGDDDQRRPVLSAARGEHAVPGRKSSLPKLHACLSELHYPTPHSRAIVSLPAFAATASRSMPWLLFKAATALA